MELDISESKLSVENIPAFLELSNEFINFIKDKSHFGKDYKRIADYLDVVEILKDGDTNYFLEKLNEFKETNDGKIILAQFKNFFDSKYKEEESKTEKDNKIIQELRKEIKGIVSAFMKEYDTLPNDELCNLTNLIASMSKMLKDFDITRDHTQFQIDISHNEELLSILEIGRNNEELNAI